MHTSLFRAYRVPRLCVSLTGARLLTAVVKTLLQPLDVVTVCPV